MDLTAPDALHRQYSPRVALVTGAAQGIGHAIAHRLADDGINIAINDVPDKSEQLEIVAAELRVKGRRALVVPGDVSVELDVINMVSRAVEELGFLDIVSLVNKHTSNRARLLMVFFSVDRERRHRSCLRLSGLYGCLSHPYLIYRLTIVL